MIVALKTLACLSFRPLAGINYNIFPAIRTQRVTGFRPLAGINCNLMKKRARSMFGVFPSPCGDKLQLQTPSIRQRALSFRPLTEYSFTIPHIEPKEKNHPQEKHEWSRKDKS